MSEFYNGGELLSRHYMINMVCGTRAGGKSYFFKKYVLKRAIQNHTSQFALVVRYECDKSIIGNSYFNDIMEQHYKDFTMAYKNGIFILRDNRNNKKWECGYCFSLNNATKMKSSSYPNINTLILEEFINLEGKYIKNQNNPELEVELLNSMIITIFRGKGKRWRDDGKVFLISNAYSLNNPYFRYYNLINKIIEDPYKRFYTCKQTPSCICERTDIKDIDFKINRDDTAAGSKWSDFRNELHIVKNINPDKNKIIVQISFDSKKWLSIINYNDSVLVYNDIKQKDKNIIKYSCSDFQNYDTIKFEYAKNGELISNLINLYLTNSLYYDSLDTYITLVNIFNY